MTTDDELDLVETDRLMDALHRRFDCVVIGSVSDLNGEQEERGIYWRGGFAATLGLLSFMDKRFTAMVMQKHPEPQEDGEPD